MDSQFIRRRTTNKERRTEARVLFRNRKREEPERETSGGFRWRETKHGRLVLGGSDILIRFGWVGYLSWGSV